MTVGDFDGNSTPDLFTVGDEGEYRSWLNLTQPRTTHLQIVGPSSEVNLNTPFTITVTARNAAGEVDTNFAGTLSIRSSDPLATFIGSLNFTALDRGVKTIVVTARTLGVQTFSASLVGNSGISAGVAIQIADNTTSFVGPVFSIGTGSGAAIIGKPADFNRDGILDFAAVNHLANTITVFLGNGDGTHRQLTSYYSGGANPYGSDNGDLNGDGILDLVVTNTSSNNLNVFLGAGDGFFRQSTVLPLARAFDVKLADLDLDLISSPRNTTRHASRFSADLAMANSLNPSPMRRANSFTTSLLPIWMEMALWMSSYQSIIRKRSLFTTARKTPAANQTEPLNLLSVSRLLYLFGSPWATLTTMD
jgi:hypothetical protein